MSHAPRVFISYSHESAEHKQWVLALANKLRMDGLDVLLDRYVDSPEEGWPRWSQNAILEADSVLLVCTKEYKLRFDNKGAPGSGKGVAWEGLISNQILYDDNSRNKKGFIAILRDGSDPDEKIPIPYRSFEKIELYDEYERLVQSIERKYCKTYGLIAPPKRTQLAAREVKSSGVPDKGPDFSDPTLNSNTEDQYFISSLRAPFNGTVYHCCVSATRKTTNDPWRIAAHYKRLLKYGLTDFNRMEPLMVMSHSEGNETYSLTAQTHLKLERKARNGLPCKKGDELAILHVPKWNKEHPPWSYNRDVSYHGRVKYAPIISSSSWHRDNQNPLEPFDVLKAEPSTDGEHDLYLTLKVNPSNDGSAVVPCPLDGFIDFDGVRSRSRITEDRHLVGTVHDGNSIAFRLTAYDLRIGIKIDAQKWSIQAVLSKDRAFMNISRGVLRIKTIGYVFRSPMVGTFYRSKQPGDAPFVEIGDRVLSGQTLCIIEAMKSENHLPAPISGTIAAIAPQNGQALEFGEEIMVIET